MVVVEAVESYTAQTFGPQRDDLWSVRSDWHQLPVINGHVQEAGRDHGATAVTVIGAHSGARSVGLAAELAAAWPSPVRVESWHRSVILDRDADTVTVCGHWSIPELQTLELAHGPGV